MYYYYDDCEVSREVSLYCESDLDHVNGAIRACNHCIKTTDDEEFLEEYREMLNAAKQKRNEVCPGYDKAESYVSRIFEKNENKTTPVSVLNKYLKSVLFLLRFEGLSCFDINIESSSRNYSKISLYSEY